MDCIGSYSILVPRAATIQNVLIQYGDGTSESRTVPAEIGAPASAADHLFRIDVSHQFPTSYASYTQTVTVSGVELTSFAYTSHFDAPPLIVPGYQEVGVDESATYLVRVRRVPDLALTLSFYYGDGSWETRSISAGTGEAQFTFAHVFVVSPPECEPFPEATTYEQRASLSPTTEFALAHTAFTPPRGGANGACGGASAPVPEGEVT